MCELAESITERTDALLCDVIENRLLDEGHGPCGGWTMQDGRVTCACGDTWIIARRPT